MSVTQKVPPEGDFEAKTKTMTFETASSEGVSLQGRNNEAIPRN